MQLPGTTLPWAAPEVLQSMSARGLDPDHINYIDGAAADVWSAGSVLYCVLTGALPFPVRGHARVKGRRAAARRAQESWVSSCYLDWLAVVCACCALYLYTAPHQGFVLLIADMLPMPALLH